MALLLRHRRGLELLLVRSQLITGRIVETSLAALIADLHGLPSAVPAVLTVPEQQLVRGVLSHVFGCVACATHLDKNAEVARAFLVWSASSLTSSLWRTDWSRLVNCCDAVFNERGHVPTCPRATNDWVSRVLEVIHTRYRDPELSLSTVAKYAHLSPWHVARTLTSQTGQGFVAHLRRVRVSAARRLLAEDSLSVKQIAVEVGYAHPNRLDRDFMRVCGMTPSSFRHAVAWRPANGACVPPQKMVLDRNK